MIEYITGWKNQHITLCTTWNKTHSTVINNTRKYIYPLGYDTTEISRKVPTFQKGLVSSSPV